MAKKKQYGGIDILKLLMAVVVVAVHTLRFPTGLRLLDRVWPALNHYPVPVFFLAAGFLLGNRMKSPFSAPENRKILIDYFRRILRMYGIWSLIYFPLLLAMGRANGTPVLQTVVQYIRDGLFYGSHSPYPVLWYLLAVLYALLLLMLLHRWRSSAGWVLCTGLLFLFLCNGINAFLADEGIRQPWLLFVRYVYRGSFHTARIFYGCIYIPIGIFLAQHTVPLGAALAMLAAGFTGDLASLDLAWLNLPMCVLAAVGLFSAAASAHLPERKVFRLFRSMSTGIYFTHMLIWHAYSMLVYGALTFSTDAFLATLAGSAVLSLGYGVFRLSKHRLSEEGNLANNA